MDGGGGGGEEGKEAGSGSGMQAATATANNNNSNTANPSSSSSISPSTSSASLPDFLPTPIRRSNSSVSSSSYLRPPLPQPLSAASSLVADDDGGGPLSRPSAPPTPRDGENSFHRSLSNTLPRPADVGPDGVRRQLSGPLPCYEAIEEHQLLESLYSFQQQRQHQDGDGQQQGGQKGLGINLNMVNKALGPLAGSGRTVRLLGGGLFDLEKGQGGLGANGKGGGSGGGREGEPVLEVASPFVRLRDGRIVPLRTLNEEQGDFVCLTHLPPPLEEGNPDLRFNRVLPYLKSLMPTVLSTLRRQVWKLLKGLIWFLSLIWWQLLLGALISLVAYEKNHLMNLSNQHTEQVHTELKDMHRLFGSVLAFVLAFRTNNAYQSYVEGRKMIGQMMAAIRELTLEVYTALPKGHPGPSMDFATDLPTPTLSKAQRDLLDQEEHYLKAAAREVRRLCHLAFAFVRQDVRESHYGFLPGSSLENVPFTAKNFYLDPCRPRLWDLMSEEELTRYARVPIRARPGCVVGDIKTILEMMALRVERGPTVFINVTTPQCQRILNCHQAMQRIRDTPVPFPFLFIINLCVFVFVYSTPFLYYRTGTIGIMFCEMLLIFAYYGLLAIGLQIENPFAFHYGGFNLEVERFGRLSHEDTLSWAMDISGDTTSFIPAYLVDGAKDLPVSAAAAKAAKIEHQLQQQQQQQLKQEQQTQGQKVEKKKKSDLTLCDKAAIGGKEPALGQRVPTPKHAPLPPTWAQESLPANGLLTLNSDSQPILVIPPPPTIKEPKQHRWMKIEKQ